MASPPGGGVPVGTDVGSSFAQAPGPSSNISDAPKQETTPTRPPGVTPSVSGGARSIVSFALLFAGYTFAWWGWATIRGPGIGFVDLILPSRMGKVTAWLQSSPQFPGSTSNAVTNQKIQADQKAAGNAPLTPTQLKAIDLYTNPTGAGNGQG
jgi:hypothetical protein